MGSIETIVHALDKTVYEKRVQHDTPEVVVAELQYERELADFDVYHVKPHDTLQEIADRFGLNIERFAFVNSVQNNTVHPGSVMTLRDCK